MLTPNDALPDLQGPPSIASAGAMCGAQEEDTGSMSHSANGSKCRLEDVILPSSSTDPLQDLEAGWGCLALWVPSQQRTATSVFPRTYTGAPGKSWTPTKPSLQLCAHSTEQLPLSEPVPRASPGHVAHTWGA